MRALEFYQLCVWIVRRKTIGVFRNSLLFFWIVFWWCKFRRGFPKFGEDQQKQDTCSGGLLPKTTRKPYQSTSFPTSFSGIHSPDLSVSSSGNHLEASDSERIRNSSPNHAKIQNCDLRFTIDFPCEDMSWSFVFQNNSVCGLRICSRRRALFFADYRSSQPY